MMKMGRMRDRYSLGVLILTFMLLAGISAVPCRAADETEAECGSLQHVLAGDGGETEKTDSSDAAGQGRENESEQDTERGSEKESEKEPEKESERESEKEPEKESEKESEMPEPEGFYLVRVKNAAPILPDRGRVYDGTERIELSFETEVVRTDEGPEGQEAEPESVPEFRVICEARLESPDAGLRKVLCAFRLESAYPDHIKLDSEMPGPDITVEIKPAKLRVRIADGTKAYMDPADIGHISFEAENPVTVSGFVRGADGTEMIPEGFILPEADVDTSVLKKNSPAFEPEDTDKEGSSGKGERKSRRIRYENALVLKRKEDGNLTGDPTPNYVFCCEETDPDYVRGCVTITDAPVLEGADFEASGEAGACVRGGDGTLILRRGSSLSVRALSGSGYTDGIVRQNVTDDGSITFRLTRKDASGFVLARSQEAEVSWLVDAKAPEAKSTAAGGLESEGLLFFSSAAGYDVSVPADDLSGISNVRCRLLQAPLTAENLSDPSALAALSWQEIGQSGRVAVPGEGIYAVEVEVTDRVGNTGRSRGRTIVVDATAPDLTVSGAEEGGVYPGTVKLKAACSDPSYSRTSLQAELTASFDGEKPEVAEHTEGPSGAVIRFADIPHKRKADAVYTMTVTAKDRAGNESRITRTFSVNRFGSSYSLSPETAQHLKTYYHRAPFPVTFVEVNPDTVSSARILLRSGTAMRELAKGTEYTVRTGRTEKGAFQAAYTIPAQVFRQDGAYEVMLLTTDRAGNRTDSSAQGLPVRFAVDAQGPDILITGFEAGECYRLKRVTAAVQVRDNMALSDAEIYVNARPAAAFSGKDLEHSGGMIRLSISEKEEWQYLQVRASDKAGNETWSEEIPVYVSSTGPWPENGNGSGKRLSARQVSFAKEKLLQLWKQFGKKRAEESQETAPAFTFRTDQKNSARTVSEGSTKTTDKDHGVFRMLILVCLISLFITGSVFYLRNRRGRKKQYG